MMSSPRKEIPLHDIIERENLAHKSEIYDYTLGHLNESHLYKPPELATFQSWKSAHKKPVHVKKRSQLPPTREEVAAKSRVDAMEEAIASFTLDGVTNNRLQHLKKTPRSIVALKANEETYPLETLMSARSSLAQTATSERTTIHDGVFVEQLPTAELQLPSQRYANQGADLLAEPEPDRSEVIKTQLLEPTRRRQFERMKQFEREVVRTQDTKETDMLSGTRAVSYLEDRLRSALRLYANGNSGPSFHRLQIYGAVFDELIANSTIFGEFLAQVKKEYDGYVAHLLDLPPPQHRLLSMQLEQLLAKGIGQPEVLQNLTERLRELEETAKKEVARSESLRTRVEDLKGELESIPEPEVSLLRRLANENEERTVSDRLEEMKAEIWSKMDELSEMRSAIHAGLVPTAVCAQLENCCRDTEVEVHKLNKQQEIYSQNCQAMEAELKNLIEGWGLSPEEEKKMWEIINSTEEMPEEDECDEDDERKWNWYIS